MTFRTSARALRAGIVAASLAAMVGFGSRTAAATEMLTIEDVSRLIVTTGPELQAARQHAEAAYEQSHTARGRLLPSVHVSDEYQHWDSPFVVHFGAASFQARDQDTNTFAVGASQPLVGLFERGHEYKARSLGAEAAQAGVKASESTARESAELEYLNYFAAKKRGEIARASAAELDSQVKETEARVHAGTLTNADLLRVQVAQATAVQDGIVADAQATVSRSTLLVAIGRAPDDPNVDFAPPDKLLALGDMATPTAATVEQRRAEIQQAKLRAESADHDATARTFSLLPEVNVEAGYQRVDGQAFAPKN